MKTILFLVMALIATSHMAAAISRSEIIALLQQDYSVDRVLQLFQALQDQENQDLVDMDANYAVEEPALAGEIARTTGLLNAKIAECNGIEDLVNGQIEERNRLQDNVNTAQAGIATNLANIAALEDARCAANLLFIGRLAQNQEAIQFLNYLRERIADPAFAEYIGGNNDAFIQIKAAFDGGKTDEILSMMAKHHILSLLQQDGYQGEANLDTYNVRARTDAEVGTGYVDNDRGVMQRQAIVNTVTDVPGYVQQLLGYIDALIAGFRQSTDALQQAEQASVQALVEYRNRAEDENFVLNRFVQATTAAIADLSVVIANNQDALVQCRDEIPPLDQGVRLAQENYDTYVANYNDRRANLVNTLSLLQQVIEVYTNEVVNVAGTTYRERTEDYLGDQTFDQTVDFTARGSTDVIAGYQG